MKFIPKHLLQQLTQCWKRAEDNTSSWVSRHLPESNEEFITFMIYGEYRVLLEARNAANAFAKAFQQDVDEFFKGQHWHAVGNVSEGLSARLVLHNRRREAKTGGDFGLVVTMPRVSVVNGHYAFDLHKKGVLVQAKRKRSGDSWGKIHKKQGEALDRAARYSTLYLYRSESDREGAVDFKWVNMRESTVEEVSRCLGADEFPRGALFPSSTLFAKLESGQIGTSDPQIIATQIDDVPAPRAEIIVSWKGDEPPSGGSVRYRTMVSMTKEQPAVLYNRLG